MNYLFVTKQTYVEYNGEDPQSYLGAWKSAGGFIRHELLPDGTYIKQKGAHAPVTGRYEIDEGRISYESADGNSYEGEFTDGRLMQSGMIFYKAA